MGHFHHDHTHANQTRRVLTWALALNGTLLIIEAVVGYFTNSLALMSDAAHMVSDVAALSIALGASYLASRPTSPNRSFGFSGAEVLGAFVNAFGLLVACFIIAKEAVERLLHSTPDIQGLPVLAVGCVGLLINLISAWHLAKGDRDNLNVRAALTHMVADAIGSVGAITAAICMIFGIMVADPIISILIGIIILWSAWGLIRDCFGVLLGFAPRHLNATDVITDIESLEEVRGTHDQHVWSVDGRKTLLSAHVLVDPSFNGEIQLLNDIRIMLHDKHNISHTTIQLERVGSDPCGQENCA